MTHGVFDKRGNVILRTESECAAFTLAMSRQIQGELTTVLLDGEREVLFAPRLGYGKRAQTALELEARHVAVTQDKRQ